MHTKIRSKVNELNQLYHGFITETVVNHVRDRELFKNHTRQLKKWGYQFICIKTDLSSYELSTYESMLYNRMGFLRQEVRFGVENHLQRYTYYMRECIGQLHSMIYASLAKRGILSKEYFQIGEDESNYIIFRQSGDFMIDNYVRKDNWLSINGYKIKHKRCDSITEHTSEGEEYTEIQLKINELNRLYQGFLTNNYFDSRRTSHRYTGFITSLKKQGYQFICTKPDFADYELNDRESGLFSHSQLISKEEKYGIENHLRLYALYMQDCKKELYVALNISLGNRGIHPKEYFQITNDEYKRVLFRQTGSRLDEYILYNK